MWRSCYYGPDCDHLAMKLVLWLTGKCASLSSKCNFYIISIQTDWYSAILYSLWATVLAFFAEINVMFYKDLHSKVGTVRGNWLTISLMQGGNAAPPAPYINLQIAQACIPGDMLGIHCVILAHFSVMRHILWSFCFQSRIKINIAFVVHEPSWAL